MTALRTHPGIRPVRAVARDTHRESWLVRLDHDDAGPAVLVRGLDEHGACLVRAEIAALHRAQGDGVVSLLDVVDETHGAALLRAHVAGRTLAALLAERERWAAGELVTVLRPVVDAVARLHRSGVAHGALDASELVIADGGTTLVDLGHAELFAPEAPEAVLVRTAAVGADREAVRALAVDMLRRADGSRARAAQLLADEAEHRPGAELLSLLRAGLDDLAAPVPLQGAQPSPASAIATSGERLLPVVRDAPQPDDVAAEAVAAPTPASNTLGRLVERAKELLGALRLRLDALSALRRRALVAGGAAVCAAAVMLALPAGAANEGVGAAAHAEGQDRQETPALSTPVPEGAHPARSVADAAIGGDDPLAAAVALLERRADCFVELSLLCLEGVNQQGSAALDADRAAVLALRGGEEADYADTELVAPRLIERLGAGALVELGPETQPASLLLMRSEAGWRIRDWVAVGVN
jgi:hypothetical protein